VSEAELEVLKALWQAGGPATVRQLRAGLAGQGRRWAYTTVQTLLQRLEAKGCVCCDRSGPAHVFSAAVSRGELLGRELRELAERLCDGTSSPLLLALVEGGRLTAAEIDRLRRLLDDHPRAPG
jgi:predicted transcriptional regulator